MADLSIDQVWQTLEEVKDPEIPVISVVELGVVRGVSVDRRAVSVTITPTFSGCPAVEVMKQEIGRRLQELGASQVEVRTQWNPPWTSDWISDAAREKLRSFGLSPPLRHGGDPQLFFLEKARCARCGSDDTELKNSFGPTPCRAIYWCNRCRQPFEQFKPL